MCSNCPDLIKLQGKTDTMRQRLNPGPGDWSVVKFHYDNRLFRAPVLKQCIQNFNLGTLDIQFD